LEQGKARVLAAALDETVAQVQTQLPRAFESEAYETAHDTISKNLQQFVEGVQTQLQAAAKAQRCVLVRTPAGLNIAPALRGKPMGQKAFAALPKKAQNTFNNAVAKLKDLVDEAARALRDAERQAAARLAELDKQVAVAVVQPLINEVIQHFAGESAGTLDYLNALQADMIANVGVFKPQAETPSANWLNRYRVNVFVDNTCRQSVADDKCGAPVIVEDHPTYHNLLGKIEQNATASGMVQTDHMMLRPGALHRANGGFLVMRASDVYEQPYTWHSLKRALLRREIRIEDPNAAMPAPSLAPLPVPLRVKVILSGESGDYWTGYQDEDFRALFKVKAEFNWQMERDAANERSYALFLRARSQEEGLLPFHKTAVAKLVELGAARVDNQRKLSTNFGFLADVAREASFWARRNGRAVVGGDDIKNAIDERRYRNSQREEYLRDQILRGKDVIVSTGNMVGQVNGLWVSEYGDVEYGGVFRITARSFVGRGGINDIERGVNYTDSTHNKGMAIIDSYLTSLYSVEQSLQITANTAFEQSYTHTSGDSASVALLCAMLSAVGNLPITQAKAMTGTLDQFGNVMPIGGVNAKIEGWFDLLKARGEIWGEIDGAHGVVIPSKNIEDLMLREDIVEAVGAGTFTVQAVDHVSEAIEIMLALPAGERGADGKFPAGTVHAKVEAALKEINEKLDGKRKSDDGGGDKDKDKTEPPPPAEQETPPGPPPEVPAEPAG
jgi:predicted ATP-dependent protease